MVTLTIVGYLWLQFWVELSRWFLFGLVGCFFFGVIVWGCLGSFGGFGLGDDCSRGGLESLLFRVSFGYLDEGGGLGVEADVGLVDVFDVLGFEDDCVGFLTLYVYRSSFIQGSWVSWVRVGDGFRVGCLFDAFLGVLIVVYAHRFFESLILRLLGLLFGGGLLGLGLIVCVC